MADPLSLTPEQTQKLVEQGTITPQTAQAITEDPALAESALRPVNSSLEQAEESVTPEVQTPEVQAEEVQAADALETVDQVEEGPSAQDRFKRKKVELQSAGPRGFGRVVSDSQVLDALEQEDAQLLQDQQELDSERQSRLDRRRQDLQRAATLGITLEANELDDEINAADGQAPATEQDQVAAQAPTRDEVDLAAEPIRQEAAVERAAKEVLEEKEQEVAQQQKAINESIQREDERFEAEEEAQGFWAKKNTAEKIGLALSVA